MSQSLAPGIPVFATAKGPLDDDPFTFNFGPFLSLIPGDLLVDSPEPTVTSTRSDGVTTDLTINRVAVNTVATTWAGVSYPAQTVVTMWISGGTVTPGLYYTISVSITTTPGGRQDTRSAILNLMNR